MTIAGAAPFKIQNYYFFYLSIYYYSMEKDKIKSKE